jgi:hypothetical protein
MAKAIFQDPIFHNEDLARRPYQGTLNVGSASRRSKAAISFPEQIRSEPWLETPILETLRQGVSSPRCFGVARPLRGDSTGGTLPGYGRRLEGGARTRALARAVTDHGAGIAGTA